MLRTFVPLSLLPDEVVVLLVVHAQDLEVVRKMLVATFEGHGNHADERDE